MPLHLFRNFSQYIYSLYNMQAKVPKSMQQRVAYTYFGTFLSNIFHTINTSYVSYYADIQCFANPLHLFRNFSMYYLLLIDVQVVRLQKFRNRCSQPVVTRISELFYQVYIIADLTIELTKVQIYWILHKALHVFRNFWLDYLWNSDSHRSI